MAQERLPSQGTMVKEGFDEHLRQRNSTEEVVKKAISYADEFEEHLGSSGASVEELDEKGLDLYLQHLIKKRENSPERLVAIARYLAYCERPDLFIHLATILNSYDILPLMEKRVLEVLGEDKREAIFHGFEMPPLGTSTEDFPALTRRIVKRMEGELTPDQCRDVLTFNYHEIPRKTFEKKRERYLAADGLDDFLAAEHRALVEELTECLRTGNVWYEQEVTQEFVDHVKEDQSLQTGVRKGDRIIVRKVPFDPTGVYGERNPVLRRYRYCHCPLVRSALRDGKPLVSPMFCHCSAGFTKLPWEVIFDQEVEVEVLETVLGGGESCVFSVRIPENEMEKIQ